MDDVTKLEYVVFEEFNKRSYLNINSAIVVQAGGVKLLH